MISIFQEIDCLLFFKSITLTKQKKTVIIWIVDIKIIGVENVEWARAHQVHLLDLRLAEGPGIY